MHRSGTSLVASLLQNAGVNIGEELLAAKPDNPYGYFEDTDFYNFQENILTKRGLNILLTSNDPIIFDEQEVNQAKELIKSKSSHAIWGWKDPRTSLFLEFWHQLLPSAKFLFVYRHPVEVFLSLLRRGDQIDRPLTGLSAWEIYNEHILSFMKRHPEQVILCHIHGILQDTKTFNNLISKKLGLAKLMDVEKCYHVESLHHLLIPEWVNLFINHKFPGVLELYDQLQKQADLSFRDTIVSDVSIEDFRPFIDYMTEAVMSTHGRLVNRYEALREEMQEVRQNNQTLSEQIGKVRQNNQTLSEQIGKVRQNNQALSEQIGKVRQNNQALRKDNQRLYQNNQVLRNDLEKVRQDNQSLRQEIQKVRQDNQLLRQEIQKVRQDNQLLHDYNQLLRSSKAHLFARELDKYPVILKLITMIYKPLAKTYRFLRRLSRSFRQVNPK